MWRFLMKSHFIINIKDLLNLLQNVTEANTEETFLSTIQESLKKLESLLMCHQILLYETLSTTNGKYYKTNPDFTSEDQKYQDIKQNILISKRIIKHPYDIAIPLMQQNDCFGYIHFFFKDDILENDELLLSSLSLIGKLYSQSIILNNQIHQMVQLHEENDQLKQAKHQFLSNVSHEIKTPLNHVYNAMYLLGSTELSEEQKTYIANSQTSIDQLSNILEDMLDMTKIESGKLEISQDTFNLEEELIRVLRIHKHFADEKKIQLNYIFDYRISEELIGDFRKIRQILVHLVHNGIKYTEKGSVTLKTKAIENKHGFSVEFSVIDTGIGIDQEHQTQLFDIFYQVQAANNRRYQGIGLGLPISSQLTELLKGQLTFKSEKHKGSEFTITIPLQKGRPFDFQLMVDKKALIIPSKSGKSSTSTMFTSMGVLTYLEQHMFDQKVDFIICENEQIHPDVIKELKQVHGLPHTYTILFTKHKTNTQSGFDLIFERPVSRQTIYQRITTKSLQEQQDKYQLLLNAYALIVDDNRLNRVSLSSILKKLGLKSKQAASGKEAIEMVKKEHFDIILMDIQMPEMDGIEATRRIRSLGNSYQHIPIIAVTANAFFKDYDVMKTAQIHDVIFKPIHVDHLHQVLRKFISPKIQIDIPSDLFIFDQEDFKQRFEGSYDIANEVIQSFMQEYPKDLKNIEEAIKHGDLKAIEHTTHYFKGSCAYLSAKRAVWVLTNIMTYAKQNQVELIEPMYEVLLKEMDALVHAIEVYQL